jgi:hypothetical protein
MARRDYVDRRINLNAQRRAHAKTAPAGCQCVVCAGATGLHDAFMARLAKARAEAGEAPF